MSNCPERNDSIIQLNQRNSESLPFRHDYHGSASPCNSACPDSFLGPGCHKLSCVVCGQEFWALRPDRRYCSGNCCKKAAKMRVKNRRRLARNKICLFCEQPFVAKSGKARFCSLSHRVAYFRARKRNDSKGSGKLSRP